MLNDIIDYAITNRIPIMREDSVNILIDCVKEVKPRNILEIGTAIGYSGIIMLNNSPKDSHLTTIEVDEERAMLAKANFKKFGYDNRVNIIIGDANEVVPCIDVEYDLILLDGPKGHYNSMLPYLVNVLSADGVLFADNVLYLGLVQGDALARRKHRTIVNNMRKFIDSMNNTLECQLITIDDGIIIGRKRA